MKNKIYFFGIALIGFQPLFAQETLPYFTDFEEEEENEEWVEYNLGTTPDETYTWDFQNGELTHYYPVGGTALTDDWMVSPEFDFSNGAFIEYIDYKFGGFGFPFGIDTIGIYLINGSQNPEEASSITLLHLFTDETYNPDNNWNTTYDIDIPSIEGESYIAFKYQTVDNWLDVAIDELYIEGSPLSVFSNNKTEIQISVFPSPASEILKIQADYTLRDVRLYNITGALVLAEMQLNRQAQINIAHLPEGFYTLVASNEIGGQVSKKFVIQR